jgi:phospholipase/carboxylesterase
MSEAAPVLRFDAGDDTLRPLLLLHGTNGSESDLGPLAATISPGAPRLGIRGTVATERGFAYIDRLPDGRLDEAATATAAPALARVVRSSCAERGLTGRPVALGFSNGAIMAAALLLADAGLLAAAILLRPLSPYSDDRPYHLDGTRVLLLDGERDARRAPGDGLVLAERLRRGGAAVTHHVLPVGHAVTSRDARIAREWLAALVD